MIFPKKSKRYYLKQEIWKFDLLQQYFKHFIKNKKCSKSQLFGHWFFNLVAAESAGVVSEKV